MDETPPHRNPPFDLRREIPIPPDRFVEKVGETTRESTPQWNQPVRAPDGAPNVIVILLDDVGFGSSSTFGGPINTPVLDQLAREGISYNRFHTTAMCGPTRASVLSGRSHHNTAMGSILEFATGFPGYFSVIPKECATVGKTLMYNGYSTAWFGKNHNLPQWELASITSNEHWPNNMGFETFYGFIGGDSDQFHPLVYENFNPIEPYEKKDDYHFDTDIADRTIHYMQKQKSLTPDKPFFIHYAPGATHAPHQVPMEYVKKYEGRFSKGWDDIRPDILAAQKEKNICPPDTILTPRPEGLEAWADLSDDQKEVYSRMMEVFAGFLEFTDHNIGRVLQSVKDLGIEDNTLVVYICGDNGGSAEGTLQGTTNELSCIGNGLPEDFNIILDAVRNDELGTYKHYNHMPAAWAWATNTPMQWAKRYASHFGGTRNGMVMKYPNRIKDVNKIRSQFHHVMDIVPTILDIANIPQPTRVDNVLQRPMDGVSMAYTWETSEENSEFRPPILFEMLGNRGLYKDGFMWCTRPAVISWKPETDNPDVDDESYERELYDVSNDFSQGNDLLKSGDPTFTQMATDMEAEWFDIAKKNHVLPMSFSTADTWYGQVGMPVITPGRTSFRYYDNIRRIPEYCGVDIVGKNFVLEARFDLSADAVSNGVQGVIISMGGRFMGWGLLFRDGAPTWVYKLAQWESTTHVLSGKPMQTSGEFVITVEFQKTSPDDDEFGPGGTFTMKQYQLAGENGSRNLIDEVSMTLEKTVNFQFTMTETLDIGSDCGTPLLDFYNDLLPFKFTGSLKHLDVTVDTGNVSDEFKKKLHHAKRRGILALD